MLIEMWKWRKYCLSSGCCVSWVTLIIIDQIHGNISIISIAMGIWNRSLASKEAHSLKLKAFIMETRLSVNSGMKVGRTFITLIYDFYDFPDILHSCRAHQCFESQSLSVGHWPHIHSALWRDLVTMLQSTVTLIKTVSISTGYNFNL